MEIVLVMVLIAILATGVAIGFTSYINRGHESGITTDFNSSFKNPVRMQAIEKGRLAKVEDIASTLKDDGFAYAVTGAVGGWSVAPATVADADTDFGDGAAIAAVEKGNKRYHIFNGNWDGSDFTLTADIADLVANPINAILVEADHSSKDSAVLYFLNAAKNDVETLLGEYDGTDFTPE